MQDFLHFEHVKSFLKLLNPLARELGAWPTVALVALVLAFLAFGAHHVFAVVGHFLNVLDLIVKAALAAFFYFWLRSQNCTNGSD